MPRALKTRLDKIMTPEERQKVENAYQAIGETNAKMIEEEVYAKGIEAAFESQSFLDDGVGRGYLGQILQRFKRIIAWIGGTTEYRRMRSVATAMQKALDTRKPFSMDVETEELSDVKYSKTSFVDQVDEVISNTFDRENAVYVGKLPKILADVGLDADLPMLTTASHISKAILPKKPEKHQHGLSVGQIKSIPSMLENPVMILDSLNTKSNSVIVVTSMVDEEKCPVIVTIKADGKGMFNSVEIDSNFITSYYGRNRFDTFIEKNIKADNILFVNKEKADVLQTESGTQWLEQLKDINFDTIIRKTRSFVNSKSEKNQKNSDLRNSIDLEATSEQVDSTGKRLTKSQAEYFKDSKVRDENGKSNVKFSIPKDQDGKKITVSITDSEGKPVLYVVVSQEKIKTDGFKDRRSKTSTNSTSASVTVSIADIVPLVNTNSKDLLRYLPDGMLSEEQKKAKWEAIAETVKETNEKNDKHYIEALKKGTLEVLRIWLDAQQE